MTNEEASRRDAYVYAYYRDGVPVYIGKGRGDRWLRHTKWCVNRRLKNMLKSDADSGTARMSWAKVAESLSDAEAFALEVEMIAKIGRQPHGTLVNGTNGGDGGSDGKALVGRKRSAATIAKIRVARAGKKLTPEHCAKISAALKGRTRHPEEIAKTSAALKGRSSRWGYKHSEETLAKMRTAHAGRRPPDSPEIRAKKRAAMLGRKFPDRARRPPATQATRDKLRANALRQGSPSQATRDKISFALKGRKHGKS